MKSHVHQMEKSISQCKSHDLGLRQIGHSGRQSGIEFLRVLCMFGIVASHYAIHGQWGGQVGFSPIGKWFLQFASIFGTFGVDVFVISSGYFLSEKHGLYPVSRLAKLEVSVYFHSLLPFLAILIAGGQRVVPSLWNLLGATPALKAFFPVISNQWWFITDYFVLCIFAPFVNRLLANLSTREFAGLVLLELLVFSILPTTFGHVLTGPDQWFENRHVWFFVLYCAGAFVRRVQTGIPERQTSFFAIAAAVCLAISWVGIAFCGVNIRGRQQLPVIGAAVCSFLAFLRIDIGESRLLTTLSSSTLGVYLLHDHPLFRYTVWPTISDRFGGTDPFVFIPLSILAISSVYAFCVVIESSINILLRPATARSIRCLCSIETMLRHDSEVMQREQPRKKDP